MVNQEMVTNKTSGVQPQATVLFVEDNADLRENAALVLSMEGYGVRVACDGREALDLLGGGLVPDLIVSDIMMPRMDGYEFFEAVRKISHLQAVPFIFLTARSSRRDVSIGRLLGADDYLVKPFDPEDFLIAIQNKIQRAAEIRAQAAESLNDARRQLVHLLSHELRTPLTFVTGGFAMLAEELEEQQQPASSDDIRISLSLIQSGTQRLNRLAEQMVLYSEIMSGYVAQQGKEISEAVDLAYLVTDAMILLGELADGRDIRLDQSATDDEPIMVLGVHSLLITAFSEALRNAIQYSAEGSTIEIVTSIEDNCGVVTISDHGRGISPDDQGTIWNVLIQSDRERHEQQGVGMGLPILKGIVKAHHGDVSLYSVLGEGTEVTIQLPLAPGEGQN